MENNLETYLAAIEAQLGNMPAARHAEFMAEVRAHLHAMVEAKRADGLDAEAAWLHSMREFGEPEQVGRDLRRQWANSAQLETEGAPLSSRRKVRMFALPVIACVVASTLFTWIQAPQNADSWKWPLIAVFIYGCFAYGISSDVRARGGWEPSTVLGCVGALITVTISLLHLSGHQMGNGIWRDWGLPVFVLVYTSFSSWLRKREKVQRPWQFSARYKTSPVAAEQEYHLTPLIGLAMGTTLGCIGILSMAPQFFGWPLAFGMCAVSIGVAVVVGQWRSK